MIPITNLSLYPKKTKGIIIPNNLQPFDIFIYPENANFVDIYDKLGIKKIYSRNVLMVASPSRPRVIIDQNLIKSYRNINLIPIRTKDNIKDNVFIDYTNILNGFENIYGNKNYRNISISQNLINKTSSHINKHRKSVFTYIVDITKPMSNNLFTRRIFPYLMKYKNGDFPFDYFMLVILNQNSVVYTMIKKDDDMIKYDRLKLLLLGLKSSINISNESDDMDNAIFQIIDIMDDSDKEPKLKTTLYNYFKSKPKLLNKLISNKLKISRSEAYSIAIKSAVSNVRNTKSISLDKIDDIDIDRKKALFDKVRKSLLPQIVDRDEPQNNADDIILKNIDINKLNDYKDPSHVLNKRKNDFNVFFEQDLKIAFKVLEKKDPSLKLKTIRKSKIEILPGDLNPTDMTRYSIDLIDDNKKIHNINIEIPTIQEDGTFLINGKKKYLIYQILLDPIFFLKKGQAKFESMYSALSIHLKKSSNKSYFNIHIGGYSKIPLFVLLCYYIGFDETCKLFGIEYVLRDNKNEEYNYHIHTSDDKYLNFKFKNKSAFFLLESLLQIRKLITSTNYKSQDVYKSILIKLTKTRNSIFVINEILNNIVEPFTEQILKSKYQPTNLPDIILYICNELARGRVDDRNDLNYQRIRSGEVFIHQIQKAILASHSQYKFQKISDNPDAEYRINVEDIVKDLINSKLIRDMENINPIEELSCLTRITPVGEGGIPDMHAVTQQARNIHASYLKQIDPMDTPEGGCLEGLTTIYINKNSVKNIKNIDINDNILWTDNKLYKVKNKWMTRKNKFIIKTETGNIECSKDHKFPIYDKTNKIKIILKVEDIMKDINRYQFIKIENVYINIIDIINTNNKIDMYDIEVNTPDHTFILGNGIISHNSVGVINQLTVDAGITSARGSFIVEDFDESEDPKSGILSVNSAMIPYIGSTDGCRVMFSGSQGRQSIPIEGAEIPIVQTGYESTMSNLLSDSYVKKASSDGIVIKSTDNIIHIKSKNGKIQRISLDAINLHSGQGQNSLSEFKNKVKVGDRIKKNQIVAEGSHIKDGIISQGTNLLCAIMMWKGYSFEDGYIISETAANKTLASNSYHISEILLTSDDNVSFMIDEGMETKVGEPLLIRSSKSIEAMINIDLDEVNQGNIITKSPGGKILSIEVYPNTNIKRFPVIRPQYEKFKARYEDVHGKFPDKFIHKVKGGNKEQYSGVLIKIKIRKREICVLGDKITNSYGGKGVLALIEKDENMPITPFGERVDVILNPIAVINRMNPSTIKELYTSLASKLLAKKLVSYGYAKNKKAFELIKRFFNLMDGTNDKSYYKNILKTFNDISGLKYKQFIQELIDNNYIFPIIIPAFKQPDRENIEKALILVGGKTAYHLKLPEWNQKTMNPIAVGYLYYKKLEQQSGIKMSARSTGLVDTKTGQPLAGKKAGGGQRVGEMDSWSIINHGAINVLKELYGPLSDDSVTKNEIINEIIENGEASYRKPKVSPTKDLLNAYLQGLMLEAPID